MTGFERRNHGKTIAWSIDFDGSEPMPRLRAAQQRVAELRVCNQTRIMPLVFGAGL
ncbi:hypothetical protein [Bradyrhizobium acaciae]|uniref:hypothetical protein n=1 Tax=Bradyrhizobium acaciae TaxID=2683706 RepID=UPI001E32DE3B|nr:hypothetical protein [Bradyrhizobium acaciae]MCC8981578.1 hypothetical protein [Bradyrhizobium acaciae]